MPSRRFVVLDRDGTIVVERHYLSHPDQLELLPEVGRGLRQLQEMGLGLVLVTNQSAVGRGFIDAARLNEIHQRFRELLARDGVTLEGIYYCPHRPEDRCGCRKPQTGLVDRASREHGFEPRDSFVIGDKMCDLELGHRMGATTLLVRTGYGTQVAQTEQLARDYVVDDLLDAARVIRGLLRGAQHVGASSLSASKGLGS